MSLVKVVAELTAVEAEAAETVQHIRINAMPPPQQLGHSAAETRTQEDISGMHNLREISVERSTVPTCISPLEQRECSEAQGRRRDLGISGHIQQSHSASLPIGGVAGLEFVPEVVQVNTGVELYHSDNIPGDRRRYRV